MESLGDDDSLPAAECICLILSVMGADGSLWEEEAFLCSQAHLAFLLAMEAAAS